MLATPDLSLVYILVLFAVSIFILKKLFFDPILGVLDARAGEIASAEAAHVNALEEAKRAIAATEERLSAQRRAALSNRAALRGEGQAARQRSLEAARAEAEKLVSAERTKLDEQMPALKETLAREAEKLAHEVETRVLGRTLA
jgi:F-type H+-transporting ATPase subunit b